MTGGNPFAKPTAQAGGTSLTGDNPLTRPTAQATAVGAPKPRFVGAAAASRFGEPTWDHPLGTESNGRDMLAVLLVGAPRSLYIGLIAATIGMLVGTPEAVQAALLSVVFPLTFASSAFVPVDTMPSWLQAFAENQPLTKMIDTLRNVFIGQPYQTDALYTLGWSLLLLAIFFPIAISLYKKRTTE